MKTAFAFLASLLVAGFLYAQTLPPGSGGGGGGVPLGFDPGFSTEALETKMVNLGDRLLFGTDILPANTQWRVAFPTIEILVGGAGFGGDFDFALTEAASGSHASMIGLNLDFTLIDGGASTVLKETLRVSSPTGAASTRTYAIHTIGDLRIDGALIGSGSSPTGIRVDSNGLISFNDTTGNSFSSRGLTIQQGTFDNHILSFKSSDVAHGMTDITETDTYAYFEKWTAGDGGLLLSAFTEANIAFNIDVQATTETTVKDTTGDGHMVINAWTRSGANVIAPGIDVNLLAIAGGSVTKWIVDAEGDTWQSGARGGACPGQALGAAATTFSVSTNCQTMTGDGGGNTIATITGGNSGQQLSLLFNDANITITDDNTHCGGCVDLSAAFTSADDTTLHLLNVGGVWYELGRSVN